MKSKFYTVVEKTEDTDHTVSRIASFVLENDATKLAELKSSKARRDRNHRYEVVFSDLYENLDEFFKDEREMLIRSAKQKLTVEEWQAVTNL